MRRKCYSDREKLLKFKVEGSEFEKKVFTRTIYSYSERSEQFLVPGGFSALKKLNNYNSNWKKLLGFRNLQEKIT